jgi:hypothetical protein
MERLRELAAHFDWVAAERNAAINYDCDDPNGRPVPSVKPIAVAWGDDPAPGQAGPDGPWYIPHYLQGTITLPAYPGAPPEAAAAVEVTLHASRADLYVPGPVRRPIPHPGLAAPGTSPRPEARPCRLHRVPGGHLPRVLLP